MRRIAYVARVRQGKESELRFYLDKSVPTTALKQAGIEALDVFVGSGYCVFALDYDGDFQEVINQFMGSSEMYDFTQKLSNVLDDFPSPGEDVESGELPLAGEAFHWVKQPTQAI